MQATEALELPTDVPGNVRPFLAKQLKCQSLQRSTFHPQKCPDGTTHFLMRQRSAAGIRLRGEIVALPVEKSPIRWQFQRGSCPPLKATADSPRIYRQAPRAPATLPAAHALVICTLPHKQQKRKCLRNIQLLTFFDQLAFPRGKNDIAGSVTARERVGRTMMVRSISRRDGDAEYNRE